jgi:hypothetical protein
MATIPVRLFATFIFTFATLDSLKLLPRQARMSNDVRQALNGFRCCEMYENLYPKTMKKVAQMTSCSISTDKQRKYCEKLHRDGNILKYDSIKSAA